MTLAGVHPVPNTGLVSFSDVLHLTQQQETSEHKPH